MFLAGHALALLTEFQNPFRIGGGVRTLGLQAPPALQMVIRTVIRRGKNSCTGIGTGVGTGTGRGWKGMGWDGILVAGG